MTATPVDEFPVPTTKASINGLRFTQATLVNEKTRDIYDGVIIVHVQIGETWHWGQLEPPHVAQSIEDLLTLAVKSGTEYALPAVKVATDFLQDDDNYLKYSKAVEGSIGIPDAEEKK